MSNVGDAPRQRIRFVLVEPSHPGNIGGAARAMKNMGLNDLALVRPKRFPDPQADWRAAGAADLLRRAAVFDRLEDAIADRMLVAGTTGRARGLPWPTKTAEEFAALMAEPDERRVAVLFGREASGLTNEELRLCQLHLVIPASSRYPSLNLAMAVQVVAYELRKAAEAAPPGVSVTDGWDRAPATAAQIADLFQHLEAVLVDIDFLDPRAPRQTMPRLRRLLARARPDETEVAMLRGVLTHVERARGRR